MGQSVGDLVRAHRNRRGWSQERLAAKIGWTQARISNLERGQELTLDDVAAFEQAFGLNPGDLLFESGYLDRDLVYGNLLRTVRAAYRRITDVHSQLGAVLPPEDAPDDICDLVEAART